MNTGEDVGHVYTIFSSSYHGVLDKYIELAQNASNMKRDDQWKDIIDRYGIRTETDTFGG